MHVVVDTFNDHTHAILPPDYIPDLFTLLIGRVSNVTLCPQVSNISFMFINFR